MQDLTLLTRRDRPIFIDGAWHAAEGGETIPVLDPCRGEDFAQIGSASAAQVAAAAGAAEKAFRQWRHTDAAERADFLDRVAEGLQARRAGLLALQMLNNGKPRGEAELDLDDAIACFRYYAGLARSLEGSTTVRLSSDGFGGRRLRKPVGPVGLIVPWNFPLVTSAWKIAPALAAGCSVLLKVSEMTPFAELVYADIAEEIGLPGGVLNIVTGTGDVGRAITSDPHLAKLSFTGSNAVGSAVMAAAAERTVPVSLELGGKSPIVVAADADLDLAVELVLGGIFMNCGQMCSATSRLIVDEEIADELLAALVVQTRTLDVGAPETAAMGPVTTRPQYRRILSTFDRARGEDALCLTGGHALDDRLGQFVAPTIYSDVSTDSFLWREELFGPILAVRRAAGDEDALALANDTEFGLAATVVSGDPARALRLAEGIDAGHLWINAPQLILPESLWGGFRASGIGRELGPSGLAAYQQEQFITAAG